MIGINVQCVAKVWISEDLGTSYPQMPCAETEKDMGIQIVSLIEDRVKKNALPKSPVQFVLN